jgi:hypothetical protein
MGEGNRVIDATIRCVDKARLLKGGQDKNSAAHIASQLEYLRTQNYPFYIYDYLTGEQIEVTFVPPTPYRFELSKKGEEHETAIRLMMLESRRS